MGNNINFSIHTLGCKVNQYESERVAADLKKLGWGQIDFSSQADVYVINSCAVTAIATHKSRQLIRRVLKSNPDALVVATGCYADSDRDELAQIEGIGLIVGNEKKAELPRLVAEKLGVYGPNGANDNTLIMPLHTRPLVKVQDGCNQFCSYCIVPHVRGDLWSRPEAEIFDEVSQLVAGGAQEIVLTGIHLGLYGAGTRTNLGELLNRLVDIRGLGRIRLSSIELNEVTLRIVELMATSGKICNHLHIPLQSGSDRVLARMNRHYTAAEFIDRAGELKEKIDNLALTTDIIVGFPGETEDDFEGSVRLVEQVGFNKLHVFKFSPRSGTPASDFSEQVPNSIKNERSAKLIGISKRQSAEFAANYIGKNLNVLVERKQGDYLSGVSDNYIRVHMDGPQKKVGKLVTVNVVKQEEAVLYGSIKTAK